MSGKTVKTSPLTSTPKAPAWIGPFGQECWKRVIPSLIKERRVLPSDVPTLEAACSFYNSFRLSLSLRDLPAAKSAITMYDKLMSAFGVTPKARKSLDLETKEKAPSESEDSGWDLEGWV